jgi:hypothetical protein
MINAFPFQNSECNEMHNPIRMWRFILLLAVLGGWPAFSAKAQTVTFDFDIGTPTLFTGQSTPFDQMSGGITAHFSALSGVFSVQTAASMGRYTLSLFSGNFLAAGNNGSRLDIQFDRPLSSITLTFAATDFPPIETPTPLELIAYENSTGSLVVGSTTTKGTYASDTLPMGTLSFSSATPFNLVRIGIAPNQPPGASQFLVDNIAVTPIPKVSIFLRDTNTVGVCCPSALTGFELQSFSALNNEWGECDSDG